MCITHASLFVLTENNGISFLCVLSCQDVIVHVSVVKKTPNFYVACLSCNQARIIVPLINKSICTVSRKIETRLVVCLVRRSMYDTSSGGTAYLCVSSCQYVSTHVRDVKKTTRPRVTRASFTLHGSSCNRLTSLYVPTKRKRCAVTFLGFQMNPIVAAGGLLTNR